MTVNGGPGNDRIQYVPAAGASQPVASCGVSSCDERESGDQAAAGAGASRTLTA